MTSLSKHQDMTCCRHPQLNWTNVSHTGHKSGFYEMTFLLVETKPKDLCLKETPQTEGCSGQKRPTLKFFLPLFKILNHETQWWQHYVVEKIYSTGKLKLVRFSFQLDNNL